MARHAAVAWWIAAFGVTALAGARPAEAQLISPGELSSAHADLEGVRNCTGCHELRRRGIQPERCLSCHRPLAGRIVLRAGLHAGVEGGCADCHKEHLGREADIVRFDPEGFAHETRTGFALEGAHAEVACRDCHAQGLIVEADTRIFKREHGALDRTWLGLATECGRCHLRTDPHDRQFDGRACTDCHSQTRWEPAERFDHDRARFRLVGAHRNAKCAACHTGGGTTPVRYRPLAFAACTSCHEDEHDGAMGPSCTDCHGTDTWDRIDRGRFENGFDHDATGHSLRGAHAGLDCAFCHDPELERPGIALTFASGTRGRAYPRPVVESCRSCHADYHEGALAEAPGGPACTGCHTEGAWLPSTFDLFRHGETGFALEGAHLAASCTACHVPAVDGHWRFRIEETSCAGCHAEDEPHGGQFAGRACTDCHTTETFAIASFDHADTSYALEGAHADVDCAGCHREERTAAGRVFVRYAPLSTDCASCHGDFR